MSFIAELKRRNVIRVAIAYVAVAWLVLQAAALLIGAFELPNTILRGLIALLAITFIPTLVFSWVYELTPEGLKRESEIDRSASVTRLTGRKLDFLVIGVLAAIVLLLLADKLVLAPRQAARVAAQAPAAAAASPAPSAAPAIPNDVSIAVLPFIDLSQAKDQEYFTDGLSEELLDLLAKVPQLRVIARTSSFSFKGKNADIATIAEALKVANVLEGSVRKSGNTLRITAQLIRAADSSHLWSETYDRELTDVFKVQDEIAGAVVGALKLKLLAGPNAAETRNPLAHEQLLIGRQQYLRNTIDGYERAEAAFRKAVELDPDYAIAYAELAENETLLADFKMEAAGIAELKRRAQVNADKAIALAPDASEGYRARANLRMTTLWDWTGAQADCERALALAPASALALRHHATLLASLGRIPEAVAEQRRALELDPLSSGAWSELANYLFVAEGATAATRGAVERAIALNPEADFALINSAIFELFDGKLDAARAAAARASETWRIYGAALIEHGAGDEAKSKAALDEFTKRYAEGAAYQVAEIHAYRGEIDLAFEWLDRAYRQRDAGMSFMKVDRLLDNVRGDKRYAAVLARMGLAGDGGR